jgi:hypothetical protein
MGRWRLFFENVKASLGKRVLSVLIWTSGSKELNKEHKL